MPKAFDQWKVLPHLPIEKLTDNLWRVVGTLPMVSLRRAMTIARLQDGRLVVHSCIALEEHAMTEIEAWGTPAFLVVPSRYHRLDAPAYKKRYSSIRVFAPKGSGAKVAEVVPVDAAYEDFPNDETVRFEMLSGVGDAEGMMMVRSLDGVTIVLNDVVFNMDRKRDPVGFVVTTLLGSAPGPRVSRLAKHALVKDRKALRDHLERLASMPDLARLVVSHDKVCADRTTAANALRLAASYL